ncbi:MAG: FAD-dependent oxidoreductase, partial [Caulobacterales bacterium]|nr:FAD-dependent oxidoreductase [Caulobacterales bacterium]
GAAVTLETGETLRADAVIAALPFPVLRAMTLDAPLAEAQRAAIAGLPYTQITQLHFEAKAPFWESDGLAPDMWTDGPLERVFAQRRPDGALTGMFTAWLDGLGSRAADGLDEAALEALVSAEMARMRPASNGAIRLHAVVRWTDANPLAGGAYMHWAPGQIGAWADVMARPAGRLYFAGEHCGRWHTGMEGAAESGEAAARAILATARA